MLAEIRILVQDRPELTWICNYAQSELSKTSDQLRELREIVNDALRIHTFRGEAAGVQTMLDMGADVDHVCQGMTPLHIAAAKNRDGGVMDKLLTHRPDLEARDDDGYTPLHYACVRGNEGEAVAMKLLQAGAQVQTKMANGGGTALHAACVGDNVCEALVMQLLRAGAHEGALTDLGRTPENVLREGNDGVRTILDRVSRRRAWTWIDIYRERAWVKPRRSGRLPDARVLNAVEFLVATNKNVFHVVMSFL